MASKEKNGKIVKRNKKRIIIIIIISIAIIVGISIGIYFAVRPTSSTAYPDNVDSVDWKTARNKVEESKENPDKLYGLFLYNEGSEEDKNAVFGEPIVKEDEEDSESSNEWDENVLAGGFSDYTATLTGLEEYVEWISFTKDVSGDIQSEMSKFLFGTNPDEIDPIFEEIGTYYINGVTDDFGADWNNALEEPGYNATLGVSDTFDEEGKYWNTNLNLNGSAGSNESVTFGGATWIWIQNGKMIAIVDGIALDPQWEASESYWSDAEDQFLS